MFAVAKRGRFAQRTWGAELGSVRVAGVEEILLTKVAKFSAKFVRDGEMIVDDEADPCGAGDGQNGLGHPSDLFERTFLRPELNEVGTAVTELLCHDFGCPAMQIGGIDESVELAFYERLHLSTRMSRMQEGNNDTNKT